MTDQRRSRPSDRYRHVVYGDPLNICQYDGWWTNDSGKWIRVSDNLTPIPPDFAIAPKDVDNGGTHFNGTGDHVGFMGASGLEYCSSQLVHFAQKSGFWQRITRKDIAASYYFRDLVWQGFLVDNGDGIFSFTVGFVTAVYAHTVHSKTLHVAAPSIY